MTWILVGLAALVLLAGAARVFLVTRDARTKGNALTGGQGPRRQRATIALGALFVVLLVAALVLQLGGVGK